MRIGCEGVRSPQEDELRLADCLRIRPHTRAVNEVERFGSARGAYGAGQPRGADAAEESRGHSFALHQSHRSGIRVGEDGLRSVGRVDDGLQSIGDERQRFVPRRAPELSLTLCARADLRIEQASLVVRPLEVLVDFGAEKTTRERMIGIAGDARGASILDRHQHRAGVGTIVGTDRFDNFGHGEIVRLTVNG